MYTSTYLNGKSLWKLLVLSTVGERSLNASARHTQQAIVRRIVYDAIQENDVYKIRECT